MEAPSRRGYFHRAYPVGAQSRARSTREDSRGPKRFSLQFRSAPLPAAADHSRRCSTSFASVVTAYTQASLYVCSDASTIPIRRVGPDGDRIPSRPPRSCACADPIAARATVHSTLGRLVSLKGLGDRRRRFARDLLFARAARARFFFFFFFFFFFDSPAIRRVWCTACARRPRCTGTRNSPTRSSASIASARHRRHVSSDRSHRARMKHLISKPP